MRKIIKFKKNKNLTTKGFTLIELLVALAAFLILVTLVSSSAISIIKAQRKVYASQIVSGEVSYVLESMSKEIRMSAIDSVAGTTVLTITNSSGDTVDYQFINNKLQRRVNGGIWQDLTQVGINFSGGFYLEKYSGSPGNRAKVTIMMKAESQADVQGDQPVLDLQTTISSRSFYN